MYYLAHTLYLSKNKIFSNYVVEVQQERIVACFPFSGELQSMQFVDALLLSESIIPNSICDITEILPDDVPEIHRAMLYTLKSIREKNISAFNGNAEIYLVVPLINNYLSIDIVDSCYW